MSSKGSSAPSGERVARRPRRLLIALAATGISAVGLASTAAAAGAATFYVGPKGGKHARCTRHAKCRSINRAIRMARGGDTIRVARGTYREDVKIGKDVNLIGSRGATIDARGRDNGVLIIGSRAAGTLVRGFLVKNATFEGILAEHTSNVTISHNTVMGNNLGVKAAHPVGECAPVGNIPGDCGEGLHLMTVSGASIVANVVKNNAGGILVTDELGPSALNLITRNVSIGNVLDCGITLAGHSTSAVNAARVPQPMAGGVYDNVVSDNTVNDNGTVGEGGGVLLASPAPGGAVYNNVVTGNTANGNGLAGVTLHSHSPGQYLNGNVITNNSVSADGLKGDSDFGVTQSQGILVASAVDTLSGTVIAGNTISNEHFGIWTKNVPTISPSANTFSNVTVPLSQS